MKKERKSQCVNSVYSMWDPKTKAMIRDQEHNPNRGRAGMFYGYFILTFIKKTCCQYLSRIEGSRQDRQKLGVTGKTSYA